MHKPKAEATGTGPLLKLNHFLPEGFRIKIASSVEEMQASKELLHAAYVESGYMKPDENRMRINIFQALPTTTTIVATYHDQVIATASIVRDSFFGLPTGKIFSLSELKKDFRNIGEVSGLAIDKDFRGHNGIVLFNMVKFIYRYSAEFAHLDCLLISVNPKQQSFYDDVLGFKTVDCKTIDEYDFVSGAPAIGRYLCLNTYKEMYKAKYGDYKEESRNLYKFLFESFSEQLEFPMRELPVTYDPGLCPDKLKYFFQEKSEALKGLSDEHRMALRNMYLLPQYAPLFDSNGAGDTSRQEQRYYVRSLASLKGETQTPLVITDISKQGVCVQMDGTGLDERKQYTLTTNLVPSNQVELMVMPTWKSQENVGFRIVETPSRWLALVEKFNDWFESSTANGSIQSSLSIGKNAA